MHVLTSAMAWQAYLRDPWPACASNLLQETTVLQHLQRMPVLASEPGLICTSPSSSSPCCCVLYTTGSPCCTHALLLLRAFSLPSCAVTVSAAARPLQLPCVDRTSAAVAVKGNRHFLSLARAVKGSQTFMVLVTQRSHHNASIAFCNTNCHAQIQIIVSSCYCIAHQIAGPNKFSSWQHL